MNSSAPSRWSLTSTGNRVLLAVLLGLIAFWTTGSVALLAVIAVLTYVIASAVARPAATSRRR